MSERHDDNDGSGIFWPGYVDATTNLILNLLFLLTILIVAVFMFALELGRSSTEDISSPQPQIEQTQVTSIEDLSSENALLRQELERLKMLLAEQKKKLQRVQIIEAQARAPKPAKGLDKTSAADFELMVRFKDESIAFTEQEHDQLIESLRPVLKNDKASIFVEVPGGFTEAKRLGFYRAMAVRNLLIEMKLPKDKIDVAVIEGASSANASIVRVRTHR